MGDANLHFLRRRPVSQRPCPLLAFLYFLDIYKKIKHQHAHLHRNKRHKISRLNLTQILQRASALADPEGEGEGGGAFFLLMGFSAEKG